MAELGRYYEIESQVLGPKEAVEVHPLIAVDDVLGKLLYYCRACVDCRRLTSVPEVLCTRPQMAR